MRRPISTRCKPGTAPFSPGVRASGHIRHSLLGLYLLAVLLPLSLAGRAEAQPPERQRVSIVVPPAAPPGFDEKRLVERVRVYLDSMGVDATNTPGQSARFVLELRWPEAKMTPLEGVVLDTAARPAKRYSFDIGFAQSWPEFERLVALKLRSILRVAITEQAELQREPARADAGIATAGRPESGFRQRARFVLELGGAAMLGDALDDVQPAGATRLALGLGDWAFGIASTFALPAARHTEQASSDASEASFAASLRYDFLSVGESRAVVELGIDAGLFVARVKAERAGEERIAYALSPLVSAAVLGGYRLVPDGAVAVLLGPSADWLVTRSEVTVGGVSVYDSGRFRYGLQLKVNFAF